ncbi:TlyA family RNA methyltransferase [Parazoarcus communis]|uniref:TlyA family rRNA (Cytidine-2'-O)-methyltransferase n=1 Tax=Parazoarcus communis SWub3 = DSM 12120 TaxID=1121029 RepID=A0A323V2I5_9RHOO|nr:TlyA family RNA methyltransferase [Parazoarcus communis]NMG70047.1 TlyA family rRNA (cytidine-2'-O)-methyltransferase [Parazoarcus communis SWub3 = DSM 12120]PZA18230.1 TlyA family rRNA (cytidine-2'-O)-methyltransferase [Azoarcus communis] [Parazoarcus communis SWub3 = DSM 12120]
MSMNSFHRRQSRPATSPPPPPAVSDRGLPRADQLLVQQGLAASRTAARLLIEAGRVSADGAVVSKPAQTLLPSAVIIIQADPGDRYVSRGGLKLAGALTTSGLNPNGQICLDIGQSTGGFSDCLLQAGASKVVGVEVGHGQLHPRLATEPRCLTLEGLNARHLVASDLGQDYPPGGFKLIVCDASFISLTLLLPQWPALLATDGDILALVKPQFEVGPRGLSKGGIVRDASLYVDVEHKLRSAAANCGLKVLGWFDSPITGTDGNREFFIWMRHAQH